MENVCAACREEKSVRGFSFLMGTVLAVGLTMFYLVDFIHCFRLRMGGMEEEDEPAVGRLKIY